MVKDVPLPAMPPGLRVQLPAGRLFNTTEPVATVQVGCVMSPTVGADGSGVTVTVSVAGRAHWFAAGVNVYVEVPAVAVLMTDGFQVPATPLEELPGNEGAAAFWQKGPIAAKVGVMLLVTTTVVLPVPVQPLASVTVTL